MQGKLNGLAVRVPLTNSSITDCVFEVDKPTSVEEVNKLLKVGQAVGQALLRGRECCGTHSGRGCICSMRPFHMDPRCNA